MSKSDPSAKPEISDESNQTKSDSQERETKAETSEDSSSSSYDANLDFYSSDFDPLKALQCNKLKPPDPNMPPCDNLAKYSSKYSWDNPIKGMADTTQQPTTSKSAESSKQQKVREELPERRWLPHQLPIRKERKQNQRPNLINRMATTRGPLQRLFQCIMERTKVKVYTRNERGIRGYCFGFVTFFDKHWNMSMEDVTEVWTRRKKQKLPAFGDTNDADQNELLQKVKRIFPTVKVIKQDKKSETCERYVKQLIIRGEQISHILIHSDDSDQK